MVSEIITLEGHIIDSKLLANVMDDIITFGGEFQLLEVHIGQSRQERSLARIEVRTEGTQKMNELLSLLTRHGAIWHSGGDAELVEADMDGAFPEEFYSSTNHRTYIRWKGEWTEVQNQEMDCGVMLDPATNTFRIRPMHQVRKGDRLVCGNRGIRVVPVEQRRSRGLFEFMASDISSEKPKSTIIRNTAALMHQVKQRGERFLLVGGPAIVHTGAADHVVRLIETGYVHVLFAGNALAVHDIEHNLYGTSLGVYIDKAVLADAGHEHHLRAINTIRRVGGIRRAVEQGVLTGGIMHACVKNGVEIVLAGSVRDDGPLPDTISDMLVAQDKMREAIRGVGFALMVATALHSIATGNILPGWVPAVCVDITPGVLTKLADRGSFQTIGLVTDVEPFFRELVQEIEKLG